MPTEPGGSELEPRLNELTEQLETAREEICDIPHVGHLNTGELIRVEETLSIAAETAKAVVSIRRRMRANQERDDALDDAPDDRSDGDRRLDDDRGQADARPSA